MSNARILDKRDTSLLVLEGTYSRYYLSATIKDSLSKSRFGVQDDIYRFLRTAKRPNAFWESLLLWDKFITYGPSPVLNVPSHYYKANPGQSRETHLDPFNLGHISKAGVPFGINDLPEDFYEEGNVGAELITPELLYQVVTSHSTIGNYAQVGPVFPEPVPEVLEYWRFLNLSKSTLLAIVELCIMAGKTLFSRMPKGIIFKGYEESDYVETVEFPPFQNLIEGIAEILRKEALAGKLTYMGKTIPPDLPTFEYYAVARAIMGSLHNAYYYLDGLLTPWRLGVDLLSSSMDAIRGKTIRDFHNIQTDALIKAKLYTGTIEYWPSPKSQSEFEDIHFDSRIEILRQNFQAWKESALEGNFARAHKFQGDLNLASKSLKRLRNIRRLISIEVYVSATLGMLIPYSDVMFLPVSILLKKVEKHEVENLGTMGIKVV